MNININFKEKTIQMISEISFDELMELFEKMPILKDFKIIPNQQLVQNPIIYPSPWDINQPYPSNPIDWMRPYYLTNPTCNPLEIEYNPTNICNHSSDSTSQYFSNQMQN